jgi:hypothetical protein
MIQQGFFWPVDCPYDVAMKLWPIHTHAFSTEHISLRHEFAIGPIRYDATLGENAREYYCIRCKWIFVVGRKKIAFLDGNGAVVTGEDNSARLGTFENGPCPVLQAFAAERLARPKIPNGSTNFSQYSDQSPEGYPRVHARPWPGLRPITRAAAYLERRP